MSAGNSDVENGRLAEAAVLQAQVACMSKTLEVVEELIAEGPGTSGLRAALRFVRACVVGSRPIADAEGLFLLEDLKAAGLPSPRLRAVRDALRADNEALGRAVAGTAAGEGAAFGVYGAPGGAGVDGHGAPAGEAAAGDAPVSLTALQARKSCLVKWRSPEDELEGVARYVQGAVRRAGGELYESRVCVAVPDQRWGRLAQKALERRCFTVSRTQLGYALGGDPRVLGRCGVLAAFNRLALLARPDDALALRVWCGLGVSDLGAHAWVDALVRHAGEDGTASCRSLAEGGADLDAGLLARVREACAFVEAKSCLRGYSLAHAAGVEELPAFAPLMEQVDAEDDAAALFAKARRALCGPVFAAEPHAVHVATYDALASLAAAGRGDYDLVIALGAVEGLASGDGIALLGVLGAAREELVISYFGQLPAETARKMGISAARTRRAPDGEVALVRPAAALASLGDDLPPTQDGQAFLEISEL